MPHEKDPVFVESLKISGTELDERIFSEELDNEAFELDSNTSLLLLTKISDELDERTYSVADESSVEFDSSAKLEELSGLSADEAKPVEIKTDVNGITLNINLTIKLER